MNRSEVNEILRRSSAFIRSFGYVLPPFADWEPEQMRRATQEAPDIIARRLGWDVTDFGQGRFEDLGLFLFTVRNGNAADLAQGRGMLYAEKIMISRAGQRAPMHRHNIKAEDIINRGGGDLVLELFAPDARWLHRPSRAGRLCRATAFRARCRPAGICGSILGRA